MDAPPTLDVFTHNYICRTAIRLHGRCIDDPAVTRDDLQQSLYLCLVRQLPNFNPCRGAWTNFVKMVVDHAAIDVRRTFRRPTLGRSVKPSLRLPDLQTFDNALVLRPFDVDLGGHGRRTGYWPLSHTERVDLQTDVESMLQRLNLRDRKLCGLLGLRPTVEAAASLGLARSTIYEQISRLRRTFEDRGLAKYF